MLTPWIKRLVALLLLPLLAAEGWTLFDLVVAWIPRGQWHALPFLMALAGFVVWLAIFFALPRPMWVYVLGHELTHALAVYLSGGRVYDFKVGSRGGHVATDKVNWWIVLAPYFIPLYTLLWIALWLTVDFYYPLRPWQTLFYFGFGLTYAFHGTFTVSMLHGDQSDLRGEGYFFSGVLIFMMNLLIILLLFLPMQSAMSWKKAATLFGSRVEATYCWSGLTIASGGRWVRGEIMERASR